jgi:hypothetical protein
MRVPGEAREVVRRLVIPEIVEEEERVVFRRVPKAEAASKVDASALECRTRLRDPLDRPDRHKL